MVEKSTRTLIVIFVVLAIGLFAVAWRGVTSPYDSALTGVLSNLPTNLLVVVVGVPIAIWLALSGERREIKRLYEQTLERRRNVLTILKRDLVDVMDNLAMRVLAQGDTESYTPIFPWISDGLWAALANGGELRWIDSASVIDALAKAYADVQGLSHIEHMYAEYVKYPGIRGVDQETTDIFKGECLIFVQNARRTIAATIPILDRALESKQVGPINRKYLPEIRVAGNSAPIVR
jgi:hypothetical protein